MKKRNTFILGILLSLSSMTVLAETIPGAGEITLPDNFLINALQPLLEKISLFVGGIFGIYVIFALIQSNRERKKIKLLQDIRNDLDLLTKHFGVKHSHEKNGIFRRLFGFLWPDEEETKETKKDRK